MAGPVPGTGREQEDVAHVRTETGNGFVSIFKMNGQDGGDGPLNANRENFFVISFCFSFDLFLLHFQFAC